MMNDFRFYFMVLLIVEKIGGTAQRFILNYPSTILGVKTMQCKHGRDLGVNKKAQHKAAANVSGGCHLIVNLIVH